MTGDRADLQAQFSLAYVQAVASVAGFFVQTAERVFDKDGIDITVLQRGAMGLTTSTRLDLQVKSFTGEMDGDPWPYDLGVKAYRDLSLTSYQVPRILVVVGMPSNITDWLSHTEQQLVIRKCGYWLSLRGAPPTTNLVRSRVHLSRANLFDVAGLRSLMARIAEGVSP